MSRDEIIKNLEAIAKVGYMSSKDLSNWKLKINAISDEVLPEMLKNHGVKDSRSLFRLVVGEKVDLNDICYCMLRPTSADLHFTPKDISTEILSAEGREKLKAGFHEAMGNLYYLLSREENKDIQSVTAVSHLIKPFVAKWFQAYGFETIVERTDKIKDNKDSKLYPYYERFKKYGGASKGSIGLAEVKSEHFKTIMEEYMSEIQTTKGATR